MENLGVFLLNNDYYVWKFVKILFTIYNLVLFCQELK